MIQIDQQLQAEPDDLMRLGALDIGDKADTAGVMLVDSSKTLFWRQTHLNPNHTFRRPPALSQRPRKRCFSELPGM
jgi:hypothetical protein